MGIYVELGHIFLPTLRFCIDRNGKYSSKEIRPMAEKGDSMDEPTQTRRAVHLDGKFHPFLCSQNELRKALSKHSFDWDFRPCTGSKLMK